MRLPRAVPVSPLAWALLAGLLGSAGCERCAPQQRQDAPPPVERLIPRNAQGVLVAPSVERLVARLAELETTRSVSWAARFFGYEGGRGLVDLLFAQIGADLRDLVAVRRMGVATDRSLAFVFTASGDVILLVPYSSHTELQPALAELVARRFGARHLVKERRGRLLVHAFSSGPGTSPLVAYGLVTGYALVASGGAIAELAQLAEQTRETTLAGEPSIAAADPSARGGSDLWAYAPRGSSFLLGLPLGNTLVTATVGEDAITVKADAEWTAGPASLGLFRPLAPASIDWMLPEDTFLRVQVSGEPAPLTPLLKPLLGDWLRRELKSDAAFDFVAGLTGKLRPGVSVGFMLNPKPIGQTLFGSDKRRDNPFYLVHVLGSADALDAEEVIPAVRRASDFAPLYGRTVERIQSGEVPVYFFDGPGGEHLHLAPLATRVYFGSPLERLEKLIERSSLAPPALNPPIDGVRVQVDMPVLIKAAKGLPDSSFGIGGATVKASVLNLADALSDFRTVVLGARATSERSLHADLLIERAPRPKPRGPRAPPPTTTKP